MMHLSDMMGEDESTLTEERWEWPLPDPAEPFCCLLVKNTSAGMRCIACGACSVRDWMFSFREKDGPEDGKELIFCSDCWKNFMETGIRLFLKLTKGKCRVQGVLVDKNLVGPLLKEPKEEK